MTLSLQAVVDVDVNLPAAAAPRLGFDLGLIVGTSSVISTGTRVVVYESLAEMVTAGFATNSPEYLAATAYFAASSRPYQVAIGRQGSGETVLQAVTACRAANTDWYMVYVPGAGNSDHDAVAEYIQALSDVPSMYVMQSSDSAVLANTSGNIFATLDAAAYTRTIGIYSSSSSTHDAARIMGYAMGATSDAANSAYTLKFKTLTGATSANLTSAQVSNVEGNNGNVYINRGGYYTGLENGRTFGGAFFDQIIYRDKLANEIQLTVSDLLYTSPKVPQTESGVALICAKINQACAKLASIGYIGPGVWNGAPILTLVTGQELPFGFVTLAETIASQSSQDRANRICPPIYVAVNEAGAIQQVFITVNINQ